MIKINRTTPKEAGVSDKAIKKLKDETGRIIQHYKSQSSTTFKYAAYRDPDVKNGLKRLFNEKCAYCETRVLHAQPGDVEHFRPKAAVDTKIKGIANLSAKVKAPPPAKEKIKPGYYWLAADWNNLLLSCNTCNRKSTQLNAIKPNSNAGGITSAATLLQETLGKLDRFPYQDANSKKLILKPPKNLDKITDTRKILAKEKDLRLLIDPCEEDPATHLTFVKFKVKEKENGKEVEKEKFGMIKALTDKGHASIQVFGLARLTLVQERQRTALDVLNVLNSLQFALEGFKKAKKVKNQTEEKRNKNFIGLQLKALKGYFNVDAPYLGLKRDMLNELIKGDKKINDLFKIFGIPTELSAMGVKKA